MNQYHDLLRQVLHNGEERIDRTGTGVISLFGAQARYDLSKGFPLVTTKKVFTKAIIGELLWFLEGSTNRNRLEELTHGTRGENSTIWDEWADDYDDLGLIYGAQWRDWNSTIHGEGWGHDQIKALIEGIQENPFSRRHIVSAWNVEELGEMALPPCHTLWQVYISASGKLSLQLYQRSADLFLGVPFNIASYALLTHMLAQVTGYEPGEFIHTIGDAHIYSNHLDQVREQLLRQPRPLPKLKTDTSVKSIFAFKPTSFELEGYDPHPSIKGDVAV